MNLINNSPDRHPVQALFHTPQRISLIAFLLTLILTTTKAQDYHPTIVFLTPSEVTIDPAVQPSVDTLVQAIKNEDGFQDTDSEIAEIEALSEEMFPRNAKAMLIKELTLIKDFRFEHSLPLTANTLIGNELGGKMKTNILIYPASDKADGSLQSLQQAATKHPGQRYLVNYLTFKISKVNNKDFATARVQLYDGQQDKILLDTVLEAEDLNPGKPYDCPEGTLACLYARLAGYQADLILPIIMGKTYEFEGINHDNEQARSEEWKRILQMQEIRNERVAARLVEAEIDTTGYYFGLLNEEKGLLIALRLQPDKTEDQEDLQAAASCFAGRLEQGKWEIMKRDFLWVSGQNLLEIRLKHLRQMEDWGFLELLSTSDATGVWEGPLFR